MSHAILAFTGIAAVMAVTPGVNTALVLRSSTAHGVGHARVATLGIAAGLTCHAIAAVIGLSAIIAASGAAMNTIKWAGAAYLCYLGVQTLRSLAGRPSRAHAHPAVRMWRVSGRV
ncbi:LysE family translocator [Streptomyces sp. NPDC101151]|uniref:LysE family translocator n=1 Tax=Streptomyces sp. NPDC101151 TaxID=3366115 RepID=UPI003812F869